MTRQFTTDADVRYHVEQAIQAGEGAETIDIDGIVEEIVATVGLAGMANLAEDDDAFWAIVAKHDSTQQ